MAVKTVLFLAGEESGDLHASHLIRSLLHQDKTLKIQAFGGRWMKEAGARLIENTLDSAVVGVVEVIKSLPRLLKLEKKIRAYVVQNLPDIIVLVDYPGFHLRLLPFLAGLSKTVYFIPPKVWVWKENRKELLKKHCHRVYTIFPFEPPIYGERARYFGHPLVDFVKSSRPKTEYLQALGLPPKTKTIGLCPGSRVQEIKKMLPVFLKAARSIGEKGAFQFILVRPVSLPESLYRSRWMENLPLKMVTDHYEAMSACDLLWVTSGTVTLEALILGVPMAICNRGSLLTWLAFKTLSKTPYVGLPNILAGRQICPEFLQKDCNPQALGEYTLDFFASEKIKHRQMHSLAEIRPGLGQAGVFDQIATDLLGSTA